MPTARPALDRSRCRFEALDDRGGSVRGDVRAGVHRGQRHAAFGGRGRRADQERGRRAGARAAAPAALPRRLADGALRGADLRNPRKADHPDGYWDLGGGGSVLLRDLLAAVALAGDGAVGDELLAGDRRAVRAGRRPVRALSGLERRRELEEPEPRQPARAWCRTRSAATGCQPAAAEREGLRATPIVDLRAATARSSPPRCRSSGRTSPRRSKRPTTSLTVRFFPQQYADVARDPGRRAEDPRAVPRVRTRYGDRRAAGLVPPAAARRTPRRRGTRESGAVAYLTPADRRSTASIVRLVDARDRGSRHLRAQARGDRRVRLAPLRRHLRRPRGDPPQRAVRRWSRTTTTSTTRSPASASSSCAAATSAGGR